MLPNSCRLAWFRYLRHSGRGGTTGILAPGLIVEPDNATVFCNLTNLRSSHETQRFRTRRYAGLAGMLLPGIGLAQNKPCPPPSVSVAGGTVATTSCSTDALSDWNARSTGAGVVWAHNFDGDAEVQAFRDELAGKNTIHLGAGLGPNSASPNCLEITIPRGLYPGDVLEYAGASGGDPMSPPDIWGYASFLQRFPVWTGRSRFLWSLGSSDECGEQ